MSLSDGIYAFLSSTLSVGARVHPNRLPQGAALPALTYQLIPSEGPIYSHGGDTGTAGARVQFDCWAATYEGASSLAEEMRTNLSGVTGTWGGVSIDHCLLIDYPGLDGDDRDTGLYRRILDAAIQYHE